jgi:uncharacterized pyridoxal phosphate-containing UPF0001 family protein
VIFLVWACGGLRRAADRPSPTPRRAPEDITLVAVTKVFPSSVIRDAYELGLRDFGENYLEEFEDKYPLGATWMARFHLIGHLQSTRRSGRRLMTMPPWFRRRRGLAPVFPAVAPVGCKAWSGSALYGNVSDLEAAIEAGAAHVRVGTALFGRRE